MHWKKCKSPKLFHLLLFQQRPLKDLSHFIIAVKLCSKEPKCSCTKCTFFAALFDRRQVIQRQGSFEKVVFYFMMIIKLIKKFIQNCKVWWKYNLFKTYSSVLTTQNAGKVCRELFVCGSENACPCFVLSLPPGQVLLMQSSHTNQSVALLVSHSAARQEKTGRTNLEQSIARTKAFDQPAMVFFSEDWIRSFFCACFAFVTKSVRAFYYKRGGKVTRLAGMT